MRMFIAAALAAVISFASAAAAQAERVVTIGGDITEIVYALGEGKRLVGADETSMYPFAETKALPKVGYMRNLAAEGILSLKPELIIATSLSGPPAVLEQLKDAKIKLVLVQADESIAGVYAKVDAVAAALGVTPNAAALKASIEKRMTAVETALKSADSKAKAMFLLAQGPGGAMAAGKGTAADSMIKLAHATNVAAGFDGYKPLTPESAVALGPDVIIVAEHAVAMLGGVDKLKLRPEIAITPAGKNNRIVVMDAQLLLGFGPRTPDAVATLARAVHPTVKIDVAEAK
ncbi:MAG: ABC transporter substrate-binding protein [Alphaproteobacteria bacterium]|nr:ABC transporter substrate-binding protein [Alphaproteobacteria bacterium]